MKRNQVQELEILVGQGSKKYVRYDEGAKLYSMGVHKFMEVSKKAGAVRKINGVCIVNIEKLDKYIEEMYG